MEALAHSTEMAIYVVAQLDLLEILVKLKVIFHITHHQIAIEIGSFLNQDTLSAGYSLLPTYMYYYC